MGFVFLHDDINLKKQNKFCFIKHGWKRKPVKFSVTTPCGDHRTCSVFEYLSDMDKPVETEAYQMTSFRHVEDEWMEFDAGRLGMEENGDNPGKVEFCRGEWEIGNWKGGLVLEGVNILHIYFVRERTE